MRRVIWCAAVVAAATGAGPISAAAAAERLVTVRGAHWAPFKGLRDDPFAWGLVRTVSAAGDDDLADVVGVRGTPTSSLTRLSLAVAPAPSGIAPCWTVGFTAPDGSQQTASFEANRDERGVTATPLPGGWTQWTWSRTLPPGTIDSVSVGMDPSVSVPPTQVEVDEIAYNGVHFDGPLSSLL